MVSESEVREKLIAFLNGSVSLDQFSSWLGRESWNAHQAERVSAHDLVEEIDLALIAYSNEEIGYGELRGEFAALAGSVKADVGFTPPHVPIQPTPSFEGPLEQSPYVMAWQH